MILTTIAIKKEIPEMMSNLFLFSFFRGSKFSASKAGFNEGAIGIPMFNKLTFLIILFTLYLHHTALRIPFNAMYSRR